MGRTAVRGHLPFGNNPIRRAGQPALQLRFVAKRQPRHFYLHAANGGSLTKSETDTMELNGKTSTSLDESRTMVKH